jgi:hypothetical protein
MNDVICIFGIGQGELYEEFKDWLRASPGHFLVFLEDDENVYASLFSSPMLHDVQVRTYFISPENEESIFKQISWEFIFVPFSYKAHPDYALNRATRTAEIFAKVAFFQTGIQLLASDYSDCGVRILNNVRANTLLLPHASRGTALRNAFQGIPAIICGGGPSLAKNMEQLKDLRDKALIFAGGAALNILSAHQIMPHFGAGIDPHPLGVSKGAHLDLPFFYQDRVIPELLKRMKGPLLWMPDIGGYALERWLGITLGLSDHPFDAGWTVGNFCTAVSLHLGCHPIIFVGMDMCASEDRLYAPGVDKKKEEERLILVHDREGRPFHSRRDWVMSAEWADAFALEHPTTEFINCTEGGIGFKQIKDMPLKEATEQYCRDMYDLEGKIHAHIQLIEKIKLGQEEVPKLWQLIDESLERCQKKCYTLMEIIERTHPDSPFDKGTFILNKFELEEELLYTQFLEPLWNVWQYVFKRTMGEGMKDEIGVFVNKLIFFQNVMNSLWKNTK